MKRLMVDYRQFRLSRMGEPQFAHVKLWFTWLIYFALYFLTENLIPAEKCHVVHCFLDDIIPFNEFFLIFYVGWYVLVFGSLLYYFLYDVKRFRQLDLYIFVTQMVAMACYIFFPSRQDLRPEVFPRENFFTWVLGLIYTFDTNTGVCPSLHVAYSLAIVSVMVKDENLSKPLKLFVTVFSILVCLSTAFVKQHSVVDILAALPVVLLGEILIYGKAYWAPKLHRIHA
ncbi:MAG: phosphatidic acid phosphatase [Candidatus Faecousia sp.]|nr:phosphatidic acid phosphatase [Bacillota bacterium]MDY4754344.1 phosphatidic acid phosphatase [Candidatus Faecousia sp.]MDY6161287.1 phosphatidic acid phosphatase [Candidatus Faecousia sp.]